MGQIIGALFGGGKAMGPSKAEKAAQLDQQNRANEQRAEAERLAALSSRVSSRRQALAFRDKLGG